MGRIKNFFKIFWKGTLLPFGIRWGFVKRSLEKINLCSGSILLEGYWNIDVVPEADLVLDLENKNLPFDEGSMKTIVCISAINYFSRMRAEDIVRDVYRVLRVGGRARFGIQDLHVIAEKYLKGDRDFFFQKALNGQDRFVGETMADKVNSWFYGYEAYGGRPCKYVYDFETLALLFKKAGFREIQRKEYLESEIQEIDQIDNRPDQMFFLEAVK